MIKTIASFCFFFFSLCFYFLFLNTTEFIIKEQKYQAGFNYNILWVNALLLDYDNKDISKTLHNIIENNTVNALIINGPLIRKIKKENIKYLKNFDQFDIPTIVVLREQDYNDWQLFSDEIESILNQKKFILLKENDIMILSGVQISYNNSMINDKNKHIKIIDYAREYDNQTLMIDANIEKRSLLKKKQNIHFIQYY